LYASLCEGSGENFSRVSAIAASLAKMISRAFARRVAAGLVVDTRFDRDMSCVFPYVKKQLAAMEEHAKELGTAVLKAVTPDK
jgi:hypothetical protein